MESVYYVLINQSYGKHFYNTIIACPRFLYNLFHSTILLTIDFYITLLIRSTCFRKFRFFPIQNFWEVEFGSYSQLRKTWKRTHAKNWNILWIMQFLMFTSRRILFSISIKISPQRQSLQQQIWHFENALENVMSSKDPNYTTRKWYARFFIFPLKIVNSENLGSNILVLISYHPTMPDNWGPLILLNTKYERGFCELSES